MTTRKVRFKKLNTKTQLPVLREDQIDPNEYESLTNEAQIQTGVEQAEENEYHLQSILKASGVSSDQEIPVPPPQESDIKYEQLYSRKVQQTVSYLRFSQTVEECVGCEYDMTTEDAEFLTGYNRGKKQAVRLSEDDFERLMECFERTAAFQAPFAVVDKAVVPYDAMMGALRELDDDKLMGYAKDIYEYWKTRRQEAGNKPVHPSLKFESHQETDDMDPYVCFRRREVRQTRKTRNRDLQSGEKVKRLRREIEEARQLLLTSRDLELKKQEALLIESKIFDRRAKIKQTKVKLGIKTNDEDLINQKVGKRCAFVALEIAANLLQPQKRKAVEPSPTVRPPPTPQLRVPLRPDARSVEPDMVLLSDKRADKENELRLDIESKVQNHQTWNKNHVDLTKGPLSPVSQSGFERRYRQVKAQFPLTPPASQEDAEPNEGNTNGSGVGLELMSHQDRSLLSPSPQPEFRMRIGRLGRMWVDRRGLFSEPFDAVGNSNDRWKYDSDSEDETDVIVMDPNDTRALKFRATIPLPPAHQLTANRRYAYPPGYVPRTGAISQPPIRMGQSQPQAQAQSQAQGTSS
ncbi:histone acetyltransferase complex component [Zalerion maritima]|uniref:Enhancer of polycomb-like protein n=1 Tax=Zalerion maritima TaxID=339359 RepID=A0AAD5RPS5_9PEZI|nr:histone acetyltransferase complex component [Zalerion maritima]